METVSISRLQTRISLFSTICALTAITRSVSASIEPLGTQSAILKTILHERSNSTLLLLNHVHPADLLISLVMLFTIYGACMGLPGGLRQTLASAIKTPLIFLCTLVVCFPVLALLAILTGLNLGVLQTASLVMMSLMLNGLLLACFAPLSAFFAASSDYHFTKLLHVTIFALCGLFSTSILYGSLQIAIRSHGLESGNAMFLFLLWMLVYGFVGLQMAWTLRPMVGDPGLPFQWLRRRTSGMSVYTAISISMGEFTSPAPGLVRPDEHPVKSSEVIRSVRNPWVSIKTDNSHGTGK